MSFFPVTYFLKQFFPASWFGGGAETVGPQFGDMAATITGSGSMTGEIAGSAMLGCTMTGEGTMTGALSATVRQDSPQVKLTIRSSGGWHCHDEEQGRLPIYGDMAATMTGIGTMTGRVRATATLKSTMTGKGTMVARPLIDIARLLQRRREEEDMMAMILTAVG